MANAVKSGFLIPPKDYYKVCVRTCTYNQSIYIEDCLRGVVIQETNFPFVHFVIDDCSTDGEQEVIKAFLNRECDMANAEFYDNDLSTITIAQYKNNPNGTLVAYFLKKNLFGKPQKRELINMWQNECPYIAMCEGDDYWTHPQKLQKQVDFLEEHKEYTICFHKCKILYSDTSDLANENLKDMPGTSTIYDLANGNYIHTPSVMFRNIPQYNTDIEQISIQIDYVSWMILAHYGKIMKFDDYMAVYRHGVGIWCGKKSSEIDPIWNKVLFNLGIFFHERDNEVCKLIEKQLYDTTKCCLREYENAKNSHAYKIGRFILAPVKKIKSLFKK